MRRVFPILFVLLLAVAPVEARDEWYDHYKRALDALSTGDPATAIEHLESALERKKRSGYLRTYGNNYVRYVPYFQLGVALHGAGDCEAALASFTESESRGELAETPELSSWMQRLEEQCEQRLAPPPAKPEVLFDDPEPVVEESPPEPLRTPIDRGQLEHGLSTYLAGDFTTSVEVFEQLARATPESARLKLLLGMALHNAWVLGDETDDSLAVRARAELAEAARLDPGLVPDPALCPPRVAALYRSLR